MIARMWVAACVVCGWIAGAAAQDAREATSPHVSAVRILLVTGEDYDGHDWRETAPLLQAKLQEDPRLKVEILDHLAALGARDLTPYAALVLHFKNYDPAVPGRAGFENLDRFARCGGGLMALHFACGAFEEFSGDYERLIGRVWFGDPAPPGKSQHDPYGLFRVEMAPTQHPITAGLRSFETRDELYTCLTGEAPIELLASAVSTHDGQPHPIAFVLQDPQRRAFHCVLGHDAAALSVPQVAELLRRGAAWAAGLTPTAQ